MANVFASPILGALPALGGQTPEQRKPFEWRRANPLGALAGLQQLHGVGSLIVAIALAGLALFTVELSSVLSQGLLLKHPLRHVSPRILAVGGLLASTLTSLAFGAVTEGWMMFVVIIVGSLLSGGTAAVFAC